MAAVVSSTLAESPWMFSATSSLVAAISRIEEEDSSALCASTSTLSAIPLRLAIISPIEAEVSVTLAITVCVPCVTAALVRETPSMTVRTPPVTIWTRESVTVRFSPILLSESAIIPSSSSPCLRARAVRSQSETRWATAVISWSGLRTTCDASR